MLSFRPIKTWPEGWPNDRGTNSPFKANWSDTMSLLDRELTMLGARDPVVQLDLPENGVRLDGQLRAGVKANYRGIILSFDTRQFGTLTYSCDAFYSTSWRTNLDTWQVNLRAIALGLEALRKVERYGIAKRGQQYAGWAELPSGIALGAAMTVEEAAHFIASKTDVDWSDEVANDPLFALVLFKDAAKLTHPDQGGDADEFRKLVEAKELLEREAVRRG